MRADTKVSVIDEVPSPKTLHLRPGQPFLRPSSTFPQETTRKHTLLPLTMSRKGTSSKFGHLFGDSSGMIPLVPPRSLRIYLLMLTASPLSTLASLQLTAPRRPAARIASPPLEISTVIPWLHCSRPSRPPPPPRAARLQRQKQPYPLQLRPPPQRPLPRLLLRRPRTRPLDQLPIPVALQGFNTNPCSRP